MKRISSLVFSLVLFPALVSGQISQQLTDTLSGLLEERAQTLNVKSAGASIVFPDGSVWKDATGNLENQPTSPDMLFEMGSNTKTFTSTLMLQMADEGLLALDDPIGQYLPNYPNIADSITIKQLLRHESGIYNYTENDDFASHINNNIQDTIAVDSILNRWVKPMKFSPGEQWDYSNTNYLLLGKIIESVDGQAYHESLRDRLLNKFNLNETFLPPMEPYSMPKAGTWLTNGQYFDTQFISFLSAAWAAGAIIATPADLAEWAKKLYGGEILPDRWLDSMKQTVEVGMNTGYGLGMYKRTIDGKTYLGHGGKTIQSSEMDYSVSSDFSCVTVVNVQNKVTEMADIQKALIRLVAEKLPVTSNATVNKNFQYSLYPNPASKKFRIELPSSVMNSSPDLRFELYAMDGSLIRQKPAYKTVTSIQCHDVSKGLYLVKLVNETGKTLINRKVIVQ